jgi:hypothetical protein
LLDRGTVGASSEIAAAVADESATNRWCIRHRS